MDHPRRSELGDISGQVDAQSGNLTLKSGCENPRDQGEDVGDGVLDKRFHTSLVRSLENTTMSPPLER